MPHGRKPDMVTTIVDMGFAVRVPFSISNHCGNLYGFHSVREGGKVQSDESGLCQKSGPCLIWVLMPACHERH